MQYRRAFVPGGTFFFTVVTADRRPVFAEQKNVTTLREAFRTIRLQRPFTLKCGRGFNGSLTLYLDATFR